jgi:acetyl esterase/lipase
MPSREHDDIVAFLQAAPPADDQTLEEARAAMDAMAQLWPVADDIRVNLLDAGGVPAERIEAPGEQAGRMLVYFHGGAYTRGSAASHRSLCARLARATAAPVVSVDYRLAPEHSHPAAVDDAVAAYQWAIEHHDPARIAVAGDSAGGGLAAALLVALRDRGLPLPRAGVLLSPWLDLTQTSESMVTCADTDPLLTADRLTESARLYAGDAVRQPLVSPLFAELGGLPPLLVLASTSEVLLDDARRFVDEARAAGVDATLHLEDGLIHVWPILQGVPEAEAAVAAAGAWLDAQGW